MFQSFQFRDLHKSTYRLVVENVAVWREHWSELEGQHFRESATYCAIESNLLVRLLASEAHGLKDDGRTAVSYYLIHLPAVESNNITVEPFDIRACDEAVIRIQDFARPTQY